MTKRIFALIGLVLLIVTVAATVALAEEKITLRALLYTTQPPASLHDALIEKFQQENPNIEIVVRRVPFGELYRQTIISVASDDPPDVIYVDGPKMHTNTENKFFCTKAAK